jgi:hypothetical protein
MTTDEACNPRRPTFFDFQVQQALTHLADDVATFGPTNPLTRLIPPLDGIDPDDSFSAVPYEKGLSLLCHLSAVVGGRPIFEQFAAHYIGTFKRRTLTSADFRECFLKWCEGREIDASPSCLVISQPTWGVDVGAAALIRRELLALRDAGCAILVVSEELDELFEISDRLVVIARGRLSPALPVAEATVERIGSWMSGLWTTEVAGDAHAAA